MKKLLMSQNVLKIYVFEPQTVIIVTIIMLLILLINVVRKWNMNQSYITKSVVITQAFQEVSK